MKPWIKKPNIVEEQFCRCPPSHPVQDHDEKGCTRVTIIFKCKSRGHFGRDDDDCTSTVPCRCKVKNVPGQREKTIGEQIQEIEKVTT